MRIGIDIRECEKAKFTGIGRHIRHLLDCIENSDTTNEFVLFGNQRTDYRPHTNKCQLVIVQEKFTPIWDQFQLPHAIKENKIDIFLSFYFKAPIKSSAKLVMVINDLTPLLIKEYRRPSYFLKRIYFKWMNQLTTKAAVKLISISENTKKDFMRLFMIPSRKIDVIPLGFDDKYKMIKEGLDDVLSQYGIKKNYVLYVGNLKPHKNVPLLIRSYDKLAKSLKDLHPLVIVCPKNDLVEGLLQNIRKRNLSDHVILLHNIREEHLPYLYNGATLFVFPSLYEGFGLPIVEAMACGIPVAASNVGSLPEVVGNAGILFKHTDATDCAAAMEKILTQPSCHKQLSLQGLERSKLFTKEEMSRKYLQVLEDAYIS